MSCGLPSRPNQAGFMLLSAVFVLLICATLGAVIVHGIDQSSQSRALNYWSTQSYLFAQSSLSAVGETSAACAKDGAQLKRLEAALSDVFSQQNRVCDLAYTCSSENDTVSATVSCTINQELSAARIATKQLGSVQ